MKKLAIMNLFVVLTLLAGFSLNAGVANAAEGVHWGYEGEAGPEHWGDLSPDYALCATGVEQSPVDIASTSELNPADIETSYEPTALNIFNNGHTIQVNYDSGSSLELNGTTYNLLQFHFHANSEHTIDDGYSAMEMHLVHQSESGGLAVVGVMINNGDVANAAFDPILSRLPAEEGEPMAPEGVTVDADDLLPTTRTYYRYNGSLTTPPCSEGVKWLVMSTPIELADAQIALFTDLFDNNYRPTQALNDRSFLLTSEQDPETMPETGGSVSPWQGVMIGLVVLATIAVATSKRRSIA